MKKKRKLKQYLNGVSNESADEDRRMIMSFRYRLFIGHKCDGSLSLNDFKLMSLLGRGAYGTVVLARSKTNVPNGAFALKIQSKKGIVWARIIQSVHMEQIVSFAADHPFITRFLLSFQDDHYLYYGIEYLAYGDLYKQLSRRRSFRESQAKFLAVQIMMAIEYLHSINIAYRDLKLENTMLTKNGYLKICDFGLSKQINSRTFTMAGTRPYMAPEVEFGHGHNKSVDWYSFGVFTFELNYGPLIRLMPIPKKFSQSLKDLLRKLLQQSPPKRLGCRGEGPVEVKEHEWFSDLNFRRIFLQQQPSFLHPKKKEVKKKTKIKLPKAQDLTDKEKKMFESF